MSQIRIIEIYAQIFRQIFGNKRLLVVIGAASGVLSVLMLFSERFMMIIRNVPLFGYYSYEHSASIVLLLISLASFAIVYLQSGSSRDTDGSDNYRQSKRYYKEAELNKRRLHELREELASLKALCCDKGNGELNEKEREDIIQKIINETGEDSIKKIFDDKITDLKESFEKESSFERIVSASEDIVSRLKREISDLRLRSNINLVLGMLITLGGLYLLWTTVSIVDTSELLKQLASEGDESNYKFIKNLILPLIPRFLLVIFVEIFAYFFLRLYKDGLSEIKYFQNELTNAESKLAAVEFAYVTGADESLKEAIKSLASTERNFVLEKGQTTVELERAKSESEMTKNIIKTIPEMFKKANK